MQLAARLAGVVHAGDAGAHLEAQLGHVAHRARDREQVLAAHEEGELAAVDDDLLDGVVVARAVGLGEGGAEQVGDLVEVGPVGPRGGAGEQRRA